MWSLDMMTWWKLPVEVQWPSEWRRSGLFWMWWSSCWCKTGFSELFCWSTGLFTLDNIWVMVEDFLHFLYCNSVVSWVPGERCLNADCIHRAPSSNQYFHHDLVHHAAPIINRQQKLCCTQTVSEVFSYICGVAKGRLEVLLCLLNSSC